MARKKKTPEPPPSCANCFYSKFHSKQDHWCRRFPKWIVTSPLAHWCGEHLDKEIAKELGHRMGE